VPPPLDDLCDVILQRHHAFAHSAVPMIRGWLATLAERQPAASPHLADVRDAFSDLAEVLLGHLAKEENILFPAIAAMAEAERSGRARPPLPFPTVLHPIRMMESEHARIEAAMGRLKALTNGFVPPEGASEAWCRVLAELAKLDEGLRAHLHAENDELFPRALDLERRL
jgi:regulator of cell morphogenesis and NO signaling